MPAYKLNNQSEKDLIRKVYPGIESPIFNLSGLNRAILAPRNEDTDLLNEMASDMFPGTEHKYLINTIIEDREGNRFANIIPNEYLRIL